MSKDNSIKFCSNCGTEFSYDNLEVFLDIREELIKNDKRTAKLNKVIMVLTIGSLIFTTISLVLSERNFMLANIGQITPEFAQSEIYLLLSIAGYLFFIFICICWIQYSKV